jgi:hypothetical protein
LASAVGTASANASTAAIPLLTIRLTEAMTHRFSAILSLVVAAIKATYPYPRRPLAFCIPCRTLERNAILPEATAGVYKRDVTRIRAISGKL